MCLLFETIKVEKKKFFNLLFHNRRLNKSRKDLFNAKDEIFLENILEIPAHLDDDLYKCRVVYDEAIKEIEWVRYKAKEIKAIKVVECNDIDYSYKFLYRNIFDKLLKESNCKENEEILIIKNGRVTDTSYSNIALYNEKEWHTPMHPLLQGTKRAMLLQKGLLVEKDIMEKDLSDYKEIKLINAMLDFETGPALPISKIM